jgi:hypothetical protein
MTFLKPNGILSNIQRNKNKDSSNSPKSKFLPEKQSSLVAMEHLLAKYRDTLPLSLLLALPINDEW